MADPRIISRIIQLGKQLGANTNKFLGTRSNINFLGKGPDEGKLFQQDINTEVLANIELKSALPQIETSLGYLTAGKLNDIQANKLIDNLTKMNDFYYPITGDSIANVTDMASRTGGLTRGGIESLRGLGLKNFDNIKNRKIDPAAYEDRGGNIIPTQFGKSGPLADETAAFPSFKTTENIDASSPLMSRLSSRLKGIDNDTSVSGKSFLDKMAEVTSRSAPLEETAIMKTIPKNEIPGKTASAREFLLNALNDQNANRTVFRDVVTPQDLKAITEGGGGVDMDPIVLVQKYFGPRVAELLPSNATVEDIAIFSQRILNNATDAKGLRPTDPGFDKLTLKIEESIKPNPDGLPFADGGKARVGFKGGGADMGDPGRASERAERGYGQTADTGSKSGTNDYSNAVQNLNHMAKLPGIYDGGPNYTFNDGGFRGPLYGTNGITSVNRVTDGSLTAGYNDGDDDEEDKTINNIDTSILGPLTLDAANSIKSRNDLNAATFKELNLADGGRANYRIGGKAFKTILSKINDKMIKKAADDIFPTNDYKYDAELVVDALVENNPKLFKNLLADDLDDVLRSELYGLAVSETGTRAAMRIKAGRMERPLFDENGKLNKDAVLADASKYDGLDGKKASDVIKQGEEITSKNFGNSQFAPRSFKLNVERAISELNIPREEAERIARLSSDEQKAALQIYMDRNTAQGVQLMNYNPKKFDAAKGGLAKILEL